MRYPGSAGEIEISSKSSNMVEPKSIFVAMDTDVYLKERME